MATPGQIERARDRQLRSWHGEHVSGTARVAAESRASLSKAEREQRDIFAKQERDIRGMRTKLRPSRGGARVYSPRTATRRGARRNIPVRLQVRQVEKSLRAGQSKNFAELGKARSGWDKTVKEARVSISKIKPINYSEFKKKYYQTAKQYMAQERGRAKQQLMWQAQREFYKTPKITYYNQQTGTMSWNPEYIAAEKRYKDYLRGL